jgi:hypothetical protein
VPVVNTTLLQSWLDANNRWTGQNTFEDIVFNGVISADGPIVTSANPATHEIVVDPNGLVGGFPTLPLAVSYVSGVASSSNQWTIRLLPGKYTLSSVLTVPSYTSIIGSGRDASIITRTVNLANSVDSVYDPVVNVASTTGVTLKNLTINAAAPDQSLSGSPTSGPLAVCGSNAVSLVIDSCRLVSNHTAYEATDSAVTTTLVESSAPLFINSQFIAYGPDASKHQKSNGVYIGCLLIVDMSSSSPQNSSFDTIAITGGYLRMIGCDIRNVLRKTITNTGLGVSCVMMQNSGADVVTVWMDGCSLMLDSTAGDFNTASGRTACVDLRIGSATTGDALLYANGSQFHYQTGTVTSMKYICGLLVGQPGDNALRGQAFLSNVEIRDLAGSGGTNRKGVILDVTGVPGTRCPKKIAATNCRIADYAIVNAAGAPTLTHSNYMASEQGPNYQIGSSTFATAATVAATLPTAYPSISSGVTDYIVCLEPTIGETFWVTAKTNTGFTLNSSNAASTATVRWLIRR